MSVLLNRAFLIFLVILSFTLVIIIFLGKIYVPQDALALSPYFAKKEIKDPTLDWVNMKTKQYVSNNTESTLLYRYTISRLL